MIKQALAILFFGLYINFTSGTMDDEVARPAAGVQGLQRSGLPVMQMAGPGSLPQGQSPLGSETNTHDSDSIAEFLAEQEEEQMIDANWLLEALEESAPESDEKTYQKIMAKPGDVKYAQKKPLKINLEKMPPIQIKFMLKLNLNPIIVDSSLVNPKTAPEGIEKQFAELLKNKKLAAALRKSKLQQIAAQANANNNMLQTKPAVIEVIKPGKGRRSKLTELSSGYGAQPNNNPQPPSKPKKRKVFPRAILIQE